MKCSIVAAVVMIALLPPALSQGEVISPEGGGGSADGVTVEEQAGSGSEISLGSGGEYSLVVEPGGISGVDGSGSGSTIESGSGSDTEVKSESGAELESGSAEPALEPETPTPDNEQIGCEFSVSNFEVFNTIRDLYVSLSSRCTLSDNATITIMIDSEILESSEEVMIEYFDMGTNIIAVMVCEDGDCNEVLQYNVTVMVLESTSRLFPYGSSTGDNSFTNVLDGARPIYVPQDNPIPFFNQFYTRLWISSNGLVSFGWPYLSWWPVPFPFGYSNTPVIAPYWADFDYRVVQYRPSSHIFYQVYTSENGNNGSTSRLTNAIFEHLRQRLASSDSAALHMRVEFEPDWIAVITWNDAVPYHYYYSGNQTATFQLVLATDHLQMYAFYLYEDFTLRLPWWQRVVIGYDTKNFINYRNVDLGSRSEYSMIHNVVGNTGRMGEWLLDFSAPVADSAELRCLAWSRRQTAGNIVQSALPRCPCTLRQAFRDRRYWFGFYWGLSSRPNCATVLFSRSSSTIECCYDWSTGGLIVGPNNGGAYQLYNPLFFFFEHRIQDYLPYQDCCVNSNRCNLYFLHRHYDDCSAYIPPRFQFTFGDPHFTTIDNANFTFNGIGEYIFVRTPSPLNFHVQGRLRKFETLVNGTVLSAIVVKYGSLPPVEVHGSIGGNSEVYVGGDMLEVEIGASPAIIGDSGITSLDVSGGLGLGTMGSSITATSAMMYIRRDNDSSVIISTDEEASVTVGKQGDLLTISLEVPTSFMNQTSGLFGVFNDDPHDDFRSPQGDILNIDTSLDQEVYYNFGLLWHLNKSDSFFNYSIDNSSYSSNNDGYLSHIPTFTEDILANTSDTVLQMCDNDPKCVYDFSVTGDMNVGLSTLDTAMKNDETVKLIANTPPTISGDFTISVTYQQRVSATFKVEDSDGNTIDSFALKEPVPSGFTYSVSGDDTLEVTWSSPGISLPENPLQLFANDSEGGNTVRTVAIILCACINQGSCLTTINGDTSQLNFNDNRQYKWECSCPEFFGGDSCEIDMRGCGQFSICPNTSVCVNDTSIPSGYICDQCIPGFEIIEAMGKCIDINECLNSSACGSNQICTNNEGNYTCACEDGYRMTSDYLCQEIDECAEGRSDCTQTCTNTEGSFYCGCLLGFTLAADNRSCTLQGTCNALGICDGLDCVAGLNTASYECICPAGEQCVGTCQGSQTTLDQNTQNCIACPGNTYGPRCNFTCDCGVNGICNASVGCQCNLGWTGASCNIELNEHTPAFNLSTPSSINVRWDLNQTMPQIITILATDADVGPDARTVIYSLQPSAYELRPGASDGTDTFVIEGTTGVLRLDPSIAELNSLSTSISEFVLTIRATDRGNPVRMADHTLTIMPIPVPNYEQDAIAINIEEELPQGMYILALNCTEIGRPSGTLRITIFGEGSSNFIISESSSMFFLVIARRINYEALDSKYTTFSLSATCNNSYGLEDELSVSVRVDNINDNKFEFERAHYTAVVFENATRGEVVLSVRALDKDFPDASVTYSTNSTLFRFAPSSNDLILTGTLDREAVENYTLDISAQYVNVSGELEKTFTSVEIVVLDVNDNAPIFSDEVYHVNNITTIVEVGDHILTVYANDEDTGSNSEITYEISSPSQYFEINSTTGEIFVLSPLFPRMYEFSALALDNGINRQSASALVSIIIDPYPIALYLRFPESSVEEDIPAQSEVSRPDVTVIDNSGITINDTLSLDLTFRIVNGTDADMFVIHEGTGEIFTLGSLDYDEASTQYRLLVQATVSNDDYEISSEAVAEIFVINLDDNPPKFIPQFYATVIEQFTSPGVHVITVQASDPDNLAQIQYYINESVVPFQINITSGVIIVQDEVEDIQDYTFTVIARDGGDIPSAATVFVSVTRSLTVPARFDTDQYEFMLPENVHPGSYVGTISANVRGNLSIALFNHLGYRISDPDTIDFNATNLPVRTTSFSLLHLDQESGIISTQGNIDFDVENGMEFYFYVEVYNIFSGVAYDNASVEINLIDLNDNPPVFTRSFYTSVIDTSQPSGSIILILAASDSDSSSLGQVTFSADESRRNLSLGFSLNMTSGAIAVTNSTLIPGDYYIPVIASDGGSPPLTDEATVFVAILQSLPSSIVFTQNTYTFEVTEDAPPNTLVGAVTLVEANTSLALSNATYSLDQTEDCFSIEERTGEIRLTCTSLDRERIPNYNLVVKGRVSDTVTGVAFVELHILDINDNRPEFSRAVYSKTIDDRFGSTNEVLQVMAEDPDFGVNGSISYSIERTGGDPVFRIDNTTGRIFLINDSVDLGDYRFTVQAVDRGIPVPFSSSALILVSITRAYPQAIHFQSSLFNISENEPSLSRVGQVVLLSSEGTVVEPNDFVNDLHFSIVGGNSMGSFYIDPRDGTISSLTMFDREVSAVHIIEVLANFTQLPMRYVLGAISIQIIDVNEMPHLEYSFYGGRIDDTTPTGSVILNISAIDDDEGDYALLEFSISSSHNGMFGVRVTQMQASRTFGELYVVNELALVPGMYVLDLMATDRGMPPLSSPMANAVVFVEHSIPELIHFSSTEYQFNITENFGNDISPSVNVGGVSILDVTPALSGLVYLETGGPNSRYFSIDRSTGMISTRPLVIIDREELSVHTLNVTAYLPGHVPLLAAQTQVVITVGDLNDNAPTFTSPEVSYSRVVLSIGDLSSDSILNISATDRDAGTNAEVQYSVERVMFNNNLLTPDNSYVVNSLTGEVFVPYFNLSTGIYDVTFQATDRGSPPIHALENVYVIIQQNAPDTIEFTRQNGYVFSLDENVNAGRNVGNVTLANVPPYLQENLRFAIVENVPFVISQTSGVITNLRPIDFEVIETISFNVTITLTDISRTPPLSLSASTLVTVNIEDLNDNIPYFVEFPTELTQLEERPTTEIIYTIKANDSDSGSNARLNFTLLNTDIADTIVTIDMDTGDIIAAAGLDREDPGEGLAHSLVIQVCDSGSPINCIERVTTFRLLDINDNYPYLSSGFTYVVDEQRPLNSSAFYFEAVDPDNGDNGSVIFYFPLENQSYPFSLDYNTGEVIFSDIVIDYETTPLINLSLTLSDLGSPPRELTYTNISVIVRDMPDNPPRFSEQNYHVTTSPTVSQGELIAMVQATDADITIGDDILVYAISSVRERGNERTIPHFHINQTGHIFSSIEQEFWPEARFEVVVVVYDQSSFNLSATATVTIEVIPTVLQFMSEEYSISVLESLPQGSIVASLSVMNLSFSSNIIYNLQLLRPSGGIANRFSTNGNGRRIVNITLIRDLDREEHDQWQVEVTAMRNVPIRGLEVASAILTVRVDDVNDNTPMFTDSPNTRITVVEGVTSNLYVTRSNVSDRDDGENGRVTFTFVDEAFDFPFRIDSTTGEIRTSGRIDYETQTSYNMTVLVRDHGTPVRHSQRTYMVYITNINDNSPKFAAAAYFGEVYAQAPVSSTVKHVELILTDLDDESGQEPISFNIRPQQFNTLSDYQFQVTQSIPRQVQVVRIPESADSESRVITLVIEATDAGGLGSSSLLYLSIFTSKNLISFQLSGVNLINLLSCTNQLTSICHLMETLASITQNELRTQRAITFYNDTSQNSPDTANSVIINLYGWYGALESRVQRGELPSASPIDPVQYITYNKELFTSVASSERLFVFAFLVMVHTLVETTPPPTQSSVTPTVFPLYPVLGTIVGVVVVILVIVLLVAIACVFGRRRSKPKSKNSDEGYSRNLSRQHSVRSPNNSFQEIPLHASGHHSSLFYDDIEEEDTLVTDATIPWFDPKYLASDEETEQNTRAWSGRHLRATVDGDAKSIRYPHSESRDEMEQEYHRQSPRRHYNYQQTPHHPPPPHSRHHHHY